MCDSVTLLIQRQSEPPPPKKPYSKTQLVKAAPGQIRSSNRYWEDRFLLEDVPTADATSTAQRVIEMNGTLDEVYRVLLIGPVTLLVCRSRVVVAEVVPSRPTHPTDLVKEEEDDEEEDDEEEDDEEEDD